MNEALGGWRARSVLETIASSFLGRKLLLVMGALTSRQNAGVEEVDLVTNHAYKYPPKSGNYFGSHFIMGGERFDTPQPEAYLFGENADLNFLGSKPTPFPYPPPQPNEPTKTLKSLVNIRKESLRLVKACYNGRKMEGEMCNNPVFNLEFIFDCDVKTSIAIYYLATEEISASGVVYVPRDPSMNSEMYHYNRGAHQLFSQPLHIFDPSKLSDEELLYNPDKEIIPIAIHCVTQEGSEESKQSHTSIAVVDRHSDGTYVLKVLKQKLFVDGLCYLLQEIYGIENKNLENTKPGSDVETEDNGSECVICMCDVRDTLILPCRHLCLCNSCADSLRYQANNCPICRAPFRALLQIRALQKSSNQLSPIPPEGSCENIPAGYEGISLIEALNGPCIRPPPPHPGESDSPDQDTLSQLATSRHSLEKTPKSSKIGGSPDYEGVCGFSAQEVRMSVLSTRDCDNGKTKDKSPLLSSRRRERSKHRDSVTTVNETSLSQEEAQEEELDSEAEKLSPLLSQREEGVGGESDFIATPLNSPSTKSPELPLSKLNSPLTSSSPTQGFRVIDGMPSTSILPSGGDDSDYYTPEDPPTAILSPLHAEKERETATTGGRLSSLPGTPLSAASHRSSGDSYSSSGSTQPLLNRLVHSHCPPSPLGASSRPASS